MIEKTPPPVRPGPRDNRTVFLPNPGGRRPEALAPFPTAGQASPGEEWIRGREAMPQPEVSLRPDIKIEDLIVPHENVIMQGAGPLLLLLGRLRVAQVRAEPAQLMEQVAEAIGFFESEVRAASVPADQAARAKYILCATADDIVQNLPNEDRHIWTQYSMLSRFFGERVGGVRFFSELDQAKADPLLNYPVLELSYTCLALGFQGVHRSSANGQAVLQKIQRDLYELLRRVRPRAERDLSPHWRGQSLKREVLRTRVPVWAVAAAAGLGLFVLFLTLRGLLSGGAEIASNELNDLNTGGQLQLVRQTFTPPAQPPAPPPGRLTQLQRIRAALAPEIAAKKVDAVQTTTKIKIIVGDLVLFGSGQAVVKQQFEPIAKRIAETLQKEPGGITIVGHTDNIKLQPASPFASNWALSMARAKAVANILQQGLSDPARIEVDGKADQQPIASNETAQGRALNRRVEILLARED